jgi:hypothetical protein
MKEIKDDWIKLINSELHRKKYIGKLPKLFDKINE